MSTLLTLLLVLLVIVGAIFVAALVIAIYMVGAAVYIAVADELSKRRSRITTTERTHL